MIFKVPFNPSYSMIPWYMVLWSFVCSLDLEAKHALLPLYVRQPKQPNLPSASVVLGAMTMAFRKANWLLNWSYLKGKTYERKSIGKNISVQSTCIPPFSRYSLVPGTWRAPPVSQQDISACLPKTLQQLSSSHKRTFLSIQQSFTI